uniref:Uncharacterized protein n=1 Tax=Oryza nivara TaxID=4536 RepID=A0A0E0IGL4_ORYNI
MASTGGAGRGRTALRCQSRKPGAGGSVNAQGRHLHCAKLLQHTLALPRSSCFCYINKMQTKAKCKLTTLRRAGH